MTFITTAYQIGSILEFFNRIAALLSLIEKTDLQFRLASTQ